MIQLRDYQQDLIARTRAALAKNKRVIMTAPTGAGKTALACHMIASAVENGHRCMFLVHQNELVKQTSAAFWQNKIPHGLIVSGRARTPHAVQVASIMTLKNRLDAYESPQLVVIDECLHGDTPIVTSAGVKKIKDISVGDLAMTCKNGYSKYSEVTDVWCSGVRDLYEIKTSCNRIIKCTENHKIKTQRGWVRADQLLKSDSLYIANADAGIGSTKTNGAGSRSIFWGIRSEKEAKKNGRKLEKSFLKKGLFANADAVKMLGASTLKHLSHLFTTKAHQLFISMCKDTTEEGANGITRPQKSRSKLFTGRFWGIVRYCTPIQEVAHQGFNQTTDQSRESTLVTRHHSLMGLGSQLRTGKTKGLGQLASGQLRGAWSGSTRFTATPIRAAKKMLRKNGLIGLAASGWRGGCVTTDRETGTGSAFTRRVFHIPSRSLLKIGFLKITERFQSLAAAGGIKRYTSTLRLGTKYTKKSKISYQNQCDISLSSVKSVTKLNEKAKVYDITVPETSCFFANGILVHNCHRSAAKTYQDILAAWPDAYVVGLTATPQRTDGKGLDSVYSDIVKGPSIRYLIDHGHLCDYELYGVPQKMDLEGVRTTAGDYNKGDLEKAADKPEIVGDAVDHYLKIAKGRRCVVMCVSIKHAESVAAQYRAAGVPAAALHGLSDDRDGVLDKFESGELMVVASVQLLVEGVDLPAIGCVQWLRPTKSLVIWMQGNGRGLRPHASKDRLIILDHVQNYARHGLPDMEREWSLEGNKKQGRSGDADPDIGVPVCGVCFFSFRTGVSVCPHCGSAVELKERKLEVVDGELERIQKAQAEEQARIERRKEQGKARELEELVAVGVERGMRRPDVWGANVWAARQKRKPSAADYARAAKAWRALV